MKDVAHALRTEVEAARRRLDALTEARAMQDRGAGKWTRKEILGHLIDSANNHHPSVAILRDHTQRPTP